MSIYKKLLNIQVELKAPKGQYNSFGKYNYRNCEDILEALKPMLNQNNVTIIITDNIISVNGRNYVEATIKFIDVETGEIIETKAMAREDETKKGMDGSQITGSSSSYARKYALNGMFCIDDTKDADSRNNKDDTTTKAENKKPVAINNNKVDFQRYIKRIYAIAKTINVSAEDIKSWTLKKFGKDSLTALTETQLKLLIDSLEVRQKAGTNKQKEAV